MDLLFGKKKTPQEMLRQHQRSLNKAVREIERERTQLERQEKKLIAEIKKTAKQGQMNSCKVMAKDLVNTRNYIQKFYELKTQLQAIGLKMQGMSSNQAMAEAMKGVTKLMSRMNAKNKLPQMQKIMNDYERENEMMDMKQEMMNDAMDDVIENDEEEEENVINQVLDEIGIDTNQKLNAVTPVPELDDNVLQQRLENLRKE